MARYEPYDLNQAKMIPLSYADQIGEGSFEHALNEIVEEPGSDGVRPAVRQRPDGATGVGLLRDVLRYASELGLIGKARGASLDRHTPVYLPTYAVRP